MNIRPLLLALPAGLTRAAEAAPVKVRIIGSNDFQATLASPGTLGQTTKIPSASRASVGGAEYPGAHAAVMTAGQPDTVVVGAVDFIGATPLISALFPDEPAVGVLNEIGVDLSAAGNHEFDKGQDELRRPRRGGCKQVERVPDANRCRGFGSAAPGMFDGAKRRWLSANVVETATGRTQLCRRAARRLSPACGRPSSA